MNSRIDRNKAKAIKFWVTEEDKKKINIACSLYGKRKGDFFRDCIIEKAENLIKENRILI